MPSSIKRRQSSLRSLLESVRAPFSVTRFSERACIFSQGDACDSLLHLETGRVRLVVTTASGKQTICGVLGAGAFLGEEVLYGQGVRHTTAIAMAETEVLVIAKASMIRLLHTESAISDQFLAYVLERHTQLEAELSEQLLHSSEQRLAHALLALAECDGQQPCGCALPRVSQEVIAEMVGTTRSRVSTILGKFRQLGFVERDGNGLRIKSSLALVLDDDGVGVKNHWAASRQRDSAPVRF